MRPPRFDRRCRPEGEADARCRHPSALNFTRSSLKPLQALPFVEAGGMSRFNFGSHELALMCASHGGEQVHVRIAARMLERIGARESDLQCGCHPPSYFMATDTSPPAGVRWSQLNHNCSGKHSGFLAYCRLFGHRFNNYVDPDGPLQTRIRNVVQGFAGSDSIGTGIDGCSAPNFAMPLSRWRRRSAHGHRRTRTDTLAFAWRARPAWYQAPPRTDLSADPGRKTRLGDQVRHQQHPGDQRQVPRHRRRAAYGRREKRRSTSRPSTCPSSSAC